MLTTSQKKSGVMILISDKVDFREKIITKDNECHFIMMKRSVKSRGHKILKMYAPNNRASKNMT